MCNICVDKAGSTVDTLLEQMLSIEIHLANENRFNESQTRAECADIVRC